MSNQPNFFQKFKFTNFAQFHSSNEDDPTVTASPYQSQYQHKYKILIFSGKKYVRKQKQQNDDKRDGKNSFKKKYKYKTFDKTSIFSLFFLLFSGENGRKRKM